MAFMKDLSNFFFGAPAQTEQINRFTPQQGAGLDQLMQQGLGNMDFSGIENLAKKRFQEDTIPSIAERFTSMGSGGAQRSSAFQSSLGRAGGDLEAQLAALKPQIGAQQLQFGMQPRFDALHQTPTQGALGGGMQSFMTAMPMLLKLFGGLQ